MKFEDFQKLQKPGRKKTFAPAAEVMKILLLVTNREVGFPCWRRRLAQEAWQREKHHHCFIVCAHIKKMCNRWFVYSCLSSRLVLLRQPLNIGQCVLSRTTFGDPCITFARFSVCVWPFVTAQAVLNFSAFLFRKISYLSQYLLRRYHPASIACKTCRRSVWRSVCRCKKVRYSGQQTPRKNQRAGWKITR